MKPVLKKSLIHCGIILFFFVLSAVYMAPVFEGKIIQQGDKLKASAMSKEQVDFREKTGEYTTWNSAMFSGMPSYQIDYPPRKTALGPLKSLLTMNFTNWERDIAVVFLYLLGFYVCLLAFGCNPWLSLLGAIAFGFGSYNIILLQGLWK